MILFSWSGVNKDDIMTGKVSLGLRKMYFNEFGRGLSYNFGGISN